MIESLWLGKLNPWNSNLINFNFIRLQTRTSKSEQKKTHQNMNNIRHEWKAVTISSILATNSTIILVKTCECFWPPEQKKTQLSIRKYNVKAKEKKTIHADKTRFVKCYTGWRNARIQGFAFACRNYYQNVPFYSKKKKASERATMMRIVETTQGMCKPLTQRYKRRDKMRSRLIFELLSNYYASHNKYYTHAELNRATRKKKSHRKGKEKK